MHLHEILGRLGCTSKVLDLGSRNGSFDAGYYPFQVFRIDLEACASSLRNFLIADAARLPFPDATFDAIIANHSLEHFAELAEALKEIRRVIRPDGAFYAAVPDAGTFSDRLYRWLSHGGGHVNAFRSAPETAKLFERDTGLTLAGRRLLLSSFSFANCNNVRWSRRIALLGWGNESFLTLLSYLCRICDRAFHTKLSHYGWAFYFGAIGEPISEEV